MKLSNRWDIELLTRIYLPSINNEENEIIENLLACSPPRMCCGPDYDFDACTPDYDCGPDKRDDDDDDDDDDD